MQASEQALFIRIGRDSREPSSPPISQTLEEILRRLNFTRTCHIPNHFSIYDVPGKGGVAIFMNLESYLGDKIDEHTEAALHYIGLEENLEEQLTRELTLYFGSVNG